MIQITDIKSEKRWQTSDLNIQIVERDGRLGIMYHSNVGLEPYFPEFLYWHSNRKHYDISMDMIGADINLKNYRDSLIKDVDHIDEDHLYEILDSAFNEDYMCEYLYTHENVSRNLAKKVLDYVIEKQSRCMLAFTRKHIPDVKLYATKKLNNLKSNDDMVEIHEGIRMMLLERFMEKHGRARLQKALKRLTREQFKCHKQMADRQRPGPKGDDETLGGVVE